MAQVHTLDGIEPQLAFFALAEWGIRRDALTPWERDTICRLGHRKERYWDRHLADLCWWVAHQLGVRRVVLRPWPPDGSDCAQPDHVVQ